MSVVQLAETLSGYLEFPDFVMYGVAKYAYLLFAPIIQITDLILYNVFAYPMKILDNYAAEATFVLSRKLPLTQPNIMLSSVFMYFAALAFLYVFGQMVGKLQMKTFSIFHNFFLHALSLYMCLSILITAIGSGYGLWNNSLHHATPEMQWRMTKLIWLFYVSKLPEFGDTFIMMLKHNYRQVSFLHLYHHGTIYVIWWVVVIVEPGGEGYWSAMLNSGVHVVMYGYYLITALFKTGPIRNFANNFKFVITKGQMTQFALNVVQAVYDLYIVDPCYTYKPLMQVLLYYMISLLALFGNFLMQNQGKARKGIRGPEESDVEGPSTPLKAEVKSETPVKKGRTTPTRRRAKRED